MSENPQESLAIELTTVDTHIHTLWKSICTLSGLRARLIEDYIAEGHSQADTARLLGISPARVRQIRASTRHKTSSSANSIPPR